MVSYRKIFIIIIHFTPTLLLPPFRSFLGSKEFPLHSINIYFTTTQNDVDHPPYNLPLVPQLETFPVAHPSSTIIRVFYIA